MALGEELSWFIRVLWKEFLGGEDLGDAAGDMFLDWKARGGGGMDLVLVISFYVILSFMTNSFSSLSLRSTWTYLS